MNPTDSRQRFSSLSIALHWVTVLLISAVYATILLRENYPKGTDIREGLKTWHFMLGLAVLALLFFRLMARLGSRKPPLRSEEHTSELQSLMRTPFPVFCLKKKN